MYPCLVLLPETCIKVPLFGNVLGKIYFSSNWIASRSIAGGLSNKVNPWVRDGRDLVTRFPAARICRLRRKIVQIHQQLLVEVSAATLEPVEIEVSRFNVCPRRKVRPRGNVQVVEGAYLLIGKPPRRIITVSADIAYPRMRACVRLRRADSVKDAITAASPVFSSTEPVFKSLCPHKSPTVRN